MSLIVLKVRFRVKERLLRRLRRCRDARLRTRYLAIINLLHGRAAYETAEVLGIYNTRVYRIAKRFCLYQEAGLDPPAVACAAGSKGCLRSMAQVPHIGPPAERNRPPGPRPAAFRCVAEIRVPQKSPRFFASTPQPRANDDPWRTPAPRLQAQGSVEFVSRRVGCRFGRSRATPRALAPAASGTGEGSAMVEDHFASAGARSRRRFLQEAAIQGCAASTTAGLQTVPVAAGEEEGMGHH